MKGGFNFFTNKAIKRRTIKKPYKKGLHFVGDWHTHPEHDPSPSALDQHSVLESFEQSRHKLNGFLPVIVGYTRNNMKLWVSLHNSQGQIRLKQI